MKAMFSLQQFADELERRREEKRDFLVPPNRIHFAAADEEAEIDLLGRGGVPVASELRLNDVCHEQFADRLKIPKRFYDRLRRDWPGLLGTNVNTLLRDPEAQESKWMIRTLGSVARAALSRSYARIDNWDIATATLPALGEIPEVRVRSSAVTEVYMYVKATTPRLTAQVRVGQTVSAGVFIRNSEVGWGKFVIAPFVETLECSNGMVVERKGPWMTERVHVGRRLSSDEDGEILSDETRAAEDHAFLLHCRDVIRQAVSEVRFQETVEEMRRATATEPLEDPAAGVEVLAKREGLTERESKGILRHLAGGGDLTQWGVVSAVTRTAEDCESYDRATELETLGGEILGWPRRQWESVARAG